MHTFKAGLWAPLPARLLCETLLPRNVGLPPSTPTLRAHELPLASDPTHFLMGGSVTPGSNSLLPEVSINRLVPVFAFPKSNLLNMS